MKKIISLVSVLVLTCSLIGCTAEKQSEDKYNGFKLNVDVDEYVSRQEKKLQEYSKINDLYIKVNDEKKSIVIYIPVDISGNTDSIRKIILYDQTKLDMINNLFNEALSTFDFCNPIANYKIDLNIINKSNEESVFEIISDKEITTDDIQKILNLKHLLLIFFLICLYLLDSFFHMILYSYLLYLHYNYSYIL